MPESALKARLRQDLNAARKSRDRPRTLLLTTLLSDVRDREIELGHELSDDEAIRALVRAALAEGAGSIGAVMKAVLPQVKGRADGKRVNQIAQEELRKSGAGGGGREP